MNVDTIRKTAVTFWLLIMLVAATPVLAISSGRIVAQLVTLVVALQLLLLPRAPMADIQRTLFIFKPLAIAALLPALWMLLQIVPLPSDSIEHSIWHSSAAALSEPLTGHVSIDLGYTVRALFGYFSLISLVFLTAVLTRNRDRAEMTLFALCTISVFVAIGVIVVRDTKILGTNNPSQEFPVPLVALAVLGTILNIALLLRTFERYETRAGLELRMLHNYIITLAAAIMGIALCLTALIGSAGYDVLIATALGTIVFLVVLLVRRLGLGRWTAATVWAAAFVVCGAVVVLRAATRSSVDLLFLRFSDLSSIDVSDALRMISDSNWIGIGVGNYQSLAAIYHDAPDAPVQAAINTVTSILIEWGYVGLLMIIALLIQLLVVLLRGAISRGRDSFYAAAAAACLVSVFFQAYCDASFTTVSVQVLTAIVIGLGLSQTVGSRSPVS
jgi:hypothetical protein